MGACATKPKVQKDAAQAPEQPVKEVEEETVAVAGEVSEVKDGEKKEVVAVVEEEKKVVEREINVGEGGGDDKGKEIVGDEKVDDQSTKRHSLSNLLKESEQVKEELTEDAGEKAPVAVEAVKEATSEIETPVEKAVQEQPVIEQTTAEPLLVEESKVVVAEEPPVAQSSELVTDEKPSETVQPETEIPVESAKQEPEPTPALPVDAPIVVEAERKTADEAAALEKKPEESKSSVNN